MFTKGKFYLASRYRSIGLDISQDVLSILFFMVKLNKIMIIGCICKVYFRLINIEERS